MKNKYLLDTNIVIYYFNGLLEDAFIHDILEDSFNISIITKIEFLSWQKLSKDKELNKKAALFISNAAVYDLDEIVANETIKNRQRYKIKTPDAIIGATAIVHGFKIVTNNVNDFKQLGLKITTVKVSNQ